MSIRIVRREEVVEAFEEGEAITAAREHAKEELAHLREWLGFTVEKKREYGHTYPYELIDEIEGELSLWPDPVTLDDLKGGNDG